MDLYTFKIYPKGLENRYIEIKDDHLICNNFEVLNNVLLDFMD